jgi:hypothetical protein
MNKLEIASKLRERNDELTNQAADLIDELIERYQAATKPLNKEEIQLLRDNGWDFINPYFICILDDYDGAMAEGLHNIRRVIAGIKRKGNCDVVIDRPESRNEV